MFEMSAKRARGTKRKTASDPSIEEDATAAKNTDAEGPTAPLQQNTTSTSPNLVAGTANNDGNSAGSVTSASKKGLDRMPTISLVGLQPVSIMHDCTNDYHLIPIHTIQSVLLYLHRVKTH